MSRARPCTLIVKDDPFSDRPPRILQRDDLAVIGELVSLAGFDPEELDHVRVYMDGAEIERARWPFVVANGHVEIVRVPLGGDGDKILRTVLTIAVVVASFYVGGTVTSSLLNAGWKAGAAQAAGAAAATAVSTVGTLAINAILPPPALSGNYAADPDPVYFLEGARNQLALNQPIQTVIGRHRLMPRLAARPWPEVRGDDTYFYLVLDYGPIGVEVSDRKVGDTPLASFDGVEVQSRLTASDPHPAMASRQTVPTAVGATLAEGDWEGRFTASNTIDADVILFFPLGLGKINDKGKPRSHTVQVKFRYREVFNAGEPGETYGDWSFADAAAPGRIPFRNFGYLDGLEDLGAGPVAGTFSFTESKPGQPFYRQIGFSFPSEGTWEVELQRVGPDGDVIDRIYDDITFQTLLSKRDEAIVQRDDVAYEVVRFKASEELNGAVDTYNAVVGRLMPAFPDAVLDQSDLSGVTAADLSEERVSRNMWEQILWMARNGFEARRPYADSEINWASFAAAAKDARDRGKYFDYVVTRDVDLDELIGLAEFAGEGRCYNYNNLLEAHVDRPQPAPTHFFREGTARNISFTLTFPQDVHAYRVTFNDEADGYRQREVTIYVGGHTKATATRFERFSIAGKVNWADLHEALQQHYRNSRLQRKTGTIEVPVDRVDNTLKPMALITVATRVLAQARDSGVIRAVQTDGSGDVTGLTIDQAIPQGPAAGDLSLKWVRQSATELAAFSDQAFAMVTPGSDGHSSEVSFETPLSGSNRPQAGDEYIIGPSSVELHDFLLDRAEDNRDGWLRLYLKAYAEARFDEGGFAVPAYTPAYDLPINPAPPAPVFGLATSDEQRIVVTFTVPDGYAATIARFRVWRADAPEAGDANPGALGTFEPLADLPGDARRLVDTARTAGDRVVYRIQAIADSGRGGPVLETAVINAADDIGQPQNVAVSSDTEPGPQGAEKPLLTVTFDPDPRLALLDAVVSIRRVALDGQGVRLAEGSQPAFDQGFIADPASGRLVIRGVTAGATYDVRVYFRGRRGESGAPVTVADLVAPAVDTALAAGSAAPGGALAGQLDGFGVAIANAESSASAAQTSAAAAEDKADTALSQAGDALADAAANTTELTLVASSTAAGVSNPSRKGWTADYDKLAANANDIPAGNWINNAVQITDDGGFLAGPKTLVRYYPEMILEVETVIEVVNVGDGTFHPSITVLSIEEDGSVVYPNWTVFSDAEQTTTGVYRVVRRFRGPSAPDVTNSQALENLGNGTLLRIASSARGGGAGCTYRILSTTWRDLTKTLDVEVQAQNAQSTASTAVSNYDALSLTINNPTTGLAARALQADLLTLEGQVDSQGNLISTAVNDISAIEADLVDKQNQINSKAALTYVDSVESGLQQSISTQSQQLTTAFQNADNTLQAEYTAFNQARANDHQALLTSYNAYVTQTDSTLTSLSTLIQGNSDDISANLLSLTTLTTQTISAKANLIPNSTGANGLEGWDTSGSWGVGDGVDIGRHISTGTAGFQWAATPFFPVQENQSFAFQIRAGGHLLSGGYFDVNWYTDAGAFISNDNIALVQTGVGYPIIKGSKTAPTNAAKAKLVVGGTIASGGFLIVQKSKAEYGTVATQWNDDKSLTDAFDELAANKVEYTALIQANTDDISANLLSFTNYKASVGANNQNLIGNSQFLDSPVSTNWSTVPPRDWGLGGLQANTTVSTAGNGFHTAWIPPGERGVVIAQADAGTNYQDVYGKTFKVTEGDISIISMYLGVHRCSGELYLLFYDGENGTGNYLGTGTSTWDGITAAMGKPGGTTLSAFKRCFRRSIAPAGSVSARVLLRKFGTDAGNSDSYLFGIRPMLERVASDQIYPSPWTPAGDEASIKEVFEVQATHSDYLRARFNINLSVPGATAFLTAQAYNSSGVAYSDVGIGADAFAVYNPTTSGWQKALAVANGNVTIYGDLDVGGSITVGSVRQKVALEPLIYSVSDGQTVTFPGDFGATPQFTFFSEGLGPLSSGETYELKATNASGTGFTASLKIKTPGATANVSLTTDAAGGGSDPTRVMHKTDSADAYNGIYTFTVTGNVTVLSSNFRGPWIHTTSYSVEAFINDGGGWESVGTAIISTNNITSGFIPNGQFDQSDSYPFSRTFTVNFGDPIGSHGGYEFGASTYYGTGSVGDLAIVSYAKQTGSTYSTASPSGEVCKVEVRPNNEV